MSSGAATALSPSEQARLRREKREKRILAQGSSRLEKIAGLQGGATAREALHPDPPEADIADLESSENKSSHGSDVVREVAPAPSSPRRTVFSVDGGDEDPFNMLRRGNDPLANVPEELRDDPMLRLLLKNHLFHPGMQSDMGAAPERESSAEDLTRLAEKITRQLKRGIAGGQEPQTQQSAGPDPSALKWKFARTISIITILGYLWTQLEDFHFSRNVDVSYRWVCLYLGFANRSPYFTHSLRCLCRCKPSDSSSIRVGRCRDL